MKQPSKSGGLPFSMGSGFVATGRMSRGVVGNTTVAFVFAMVGACALCVSFLAFGHAWLAFGGFVAPFSAFFAYLWITWANAIKNPDLAVSGDEFYAQVVQHRQAARLGTIVSDQLPTLGGATLPLQALEQTVSVADE